MYFGCVNGRAACAAVEKLQQRATVVNMLNLAIINAQAR